MKVNHLPAQGLHKVSSSEASFPAHSYRVSRHKASCSSFSKSGSPCNSCILTHTYKSWKPGEYPVYKLVLVLEYANTSSSYHVVLFTHVSQLRHMDKGSCALAPFSVEDTNTSRSWIQIGSESSNPNMNFSTGKNEWKARVWYKQPRDWRVQCFQLHEGCLAKQLFAKTNAFKETKRGQKDHGGPKTHKLCHSHFAWLWNQQNIKKSEHSLPTLQHLKKSKWGIWSHLN